MSLLAELTVDNTNETQFVRCTNTPTHEPNSFNITAFGTFDGATIQIVTSPDQIVEITDISDSATTSFTDAFTRNFNINSADTTPNYIGIKSTSTGASTDITVRVYDNFPG